MIIESKARIKWAIFPLLLFYFWAAIWLSFRLPAFVAPNEVLNYEYISVMRQIRGLPNRGLIDSTVRINEWHQPPIYYLWAALVSGSVAVDPVPNPPPELDLETNPAFMSTHSGNLNPITPEQPTDLKLYTLSRFAAAFIGLITLSYLFRATTRMHGVTFALLFCSLLAFQPNLFYLSASINNDMAVTMVSAVVLAYSLHLLGRRKRENSHFMLLGFLTSLLILTKANGVFGLAYVGSVSLGVLIQERRWWPAIRSGLFSLVGLLPLWSGWLILNTIRMRDAFGVAASLPITAVLFEGPLYFPQLGPYMWTLWRSIWLDWSIGEIGYGPDIVYLLTLLFIVIGLVAPLASVPFRTKIMDALQVAFRFYKPHGGRADRVRLGRMLVVLTGFLTISYLYFATKALMIGTFGFVTPEGRWLLPALPPLFWMITIGLVHLLPTSMQRAGRIGLTMLPPVALVVLLMSWLPVLYPSPMRDTLDVNSADEDFSIIVSPSRLVPESNETRYHFEENLTLFGSQIGQDKERIPVGLPSDVVLNWYLPSRLDSDYLVSTQLIAVDRFGEWVRLFGQNSHPGQGSLPLSHWPAGSIVQDRFEIRPAADLNGPTLTHLTVWLSDGEQRISPTTSEVPGEVIELPRLNPIVLVPDSVPQPEAALHFPVVFGEQITLIAVEQNGPELTLWWEAEQSIEQDFVVFVHYFDADGNLIDQDDGPLNLGLSPTSILQAQDMVRDPRPKEIPAEAAEIGLGIYNPQTAERLMATRSDGPVADSAFIIPVTKN